MLINQKRHHNKGFTLMETLIYISVLIIITTVLTIFITWTIRANAKIKVEQETLDNARRATEIMTYEIKEAKSVYTPTSILDQNPGQLSLETTHSLPLDEKATFLDIYLCGKQICLKRENTQPSAITSDRTSVDKLTFSRVLSNTTEVVQINFTLHYDSPGNHPEWQASTTINSTITLKGY